MPDNVLNLKEVRSGGEQTQASDSIRAPALVSREVPSPTTFSDSTPLFNEVETNMSWEAPFMHDARHRARTHWYLGVLGVVGIGGAVIQRNWMLALIVALSGAIWFLHSIFHKKVSVAIDERGVHLDGDTHLHPTIDSFSVLSYPNGSHELSLKTTHWSTGTIRIPLGAQDPTRVRLVMSQYVPEGRHRQPLAELITRS